MFTIRYRVTRTRGGRNKKQVYTDTIIYFYIREEKRGWCKGIIIYRQRRYLGRVFFSRYNNIIIYLFNIIISQILYRVTLVITKQLH